ncbi:MAG TPA: NmrA family NAD(P)-binding protein [Saprospiraceae bacterium]|nr:NmrA family NAD(P)-binding protein [Saprospiraceae bacterium]
MKQIIVVAGATGNLGERITKALLEQGAEVRAIVRSGTGLQKKSHLEQLGARVTEVNMSSVEEVAVACVGATCVVSALAGLREVIIDTQKVLLDAAVKAGVPRFIPSDYSLDFTKFPDGTNRNLDWRREFHTYLDKAPIKATSIYCGGFMDMLTGQMPMIMFKQSLVMYWGNPDHPLAFTTVADTATYTAYVALDPSTPRSLWIAGDQPSPRDIQKVMTEQTGKKFRLFRSGGQGFLNVLIKIIRKMSPGKDELYPAWQGMQYMSNMIDDRSKLDRIDNERYPGMKWTKTRELLAAHLSSQGMK